MHQSVWNGGRHGKEAASSQHYCSNIIREATWQHRRSARYLAAVAVLRPLLSLILTAHVKYIRSVVCQLWTDKQTIELVIRGAIK